MLVDNERVVLRLKSRLREKRSWGQDELFRVIAELEVESVLDGDVSTPSDLVPPGTDGPLPEDRESRPEGMPESNPLLAEGARHGTEHQHEGGREAAVTR